jgi:4-hydroxythreonine-4-phosphate dehydrogenase
MIPRIAITLGEPAGVGPELVATLAIANWAAELIAIGDPALLRARATAAGVALEVDAFDPQHPRRAHRHGRLACLAVDLAAPAIAGQLDPANAAHVLETLDIAAQGARAGLFDAIVTAPVHKGVINDAGHAFTGHTEFFAERAGVDVLMLLTTAGLRVALATTHLPLARVPAAIDAPLVERCLRILQRALATDFGLEAPRIDVLGLNPHAGEGGHLGREEIEFIGPVVERLRAEGMALRGPLPADTAFLPARLPQTDAFLAMYHDQGLPVLKARGFGEAVNVTLGLPYIRTSVDHGTALELAGSGRADPSSLHAAVRLAIELGARRAARSDA